MNPKVAPMHEKIAPKGHNKIAKEAPNVAELKQKDRAILPKPKIDSLH